MADAPESASVTIMGAGLSGLAAATLLARAGREVHVHDIRNDSGAVSYTHLTLPTSHCV